MDKNEILKILETAKNENGEVPMRLVRQAFEKLPEPCMDTISRHAAIDTIVDKEATGDSEVKCLSCGHHIAERPFEVYCNIMCKWVNDKDYCTMFEPAHTMEEFMYGQDMGSPEDGSL